MLKAADRPGSKSDVRGRMHYNMRCFLIIRCFLELLAMTDRSSSSSEENPSGENPSESRKPGGLAPPPLSLGGKDGPASGKASGKAPGDQSESTDKSEALEDPSRLRELQKSLGRLEEFPIFDTPSLGVTEFGKSPTDCTFHCSISYSFVALRVSSRWSDCPQRVRTVDCRRRHRRGKQGSGANAAYTCDKTYNDYTMIIPNL